MKWFELSTLSLAKLLPGRSSKEKIANALDIRYGNYDYSQDLRAVNSDEVKNTFKKLILSDEIYEKMTLICGSNSGYELDLVNGFPVTALDLSTEALKKLQSKYPSVKTVHDTVDSLPFKGK